MARISFIDVTTTVLYGGVQTAVWQLAIALHDLGHEVAVFGGHGPIRPELGGRKIAIHTFPFTSRESVPDLGSRFQRIVERATFARHARRAVIESDSDWIILTKPFDFFWPWILPKRSRTRFAYLGQGTDFFAGDRRLAKRVEMWLTASCFNAWQIHSRYKRWPIVIFNGVDVERFSPRSLTRAGECIFGFAGRLVGWKGMSVAVRAVAEPALRNVPLKLWIIGKGPQLSELKALVRERGVSERVVFHDAVSHAELPALYRQIDVGVFPSIGDDCFPITAAEAMSCGKPAIASHIGGIPEVVGNEETCGILVPPGDPRALAEAMKRLADDPDLRRRMGQAARERICRLYTWELSARRLLKGLGL